MELSYIEYAEKAYNDSLNKLNEAITPTYRKKLDKLSEEYGSTVYDKHFFRNHPGYKTVISNADCLWCVSIHDEFKEDYGSCVLGAGFYVWILESTRHRKPYKCFILTPPTRFQGSVTWESSAPKVHSYLRKEGICALYCDGFMD